MSNKAIIISVISIMVIYFTILIFNQLNHWNKLEEKDKIIKELTEELKAGIFIEVHTDSGIFRRVVNRNDSGHIFIPESGAMIIKARSAWQDNMK